MTLILVGRVKGAFGVRGELRIATYTQEPMALARFGALVRENGAPALSIEAGRAAKDGLIVRARGVTSKEAADALRGLQLYVPREVLPAVQDEDEFYLADLIGLAAETPEGEAVGVVKAVHDFGAGDILELDPGGGHPTVLLPFTREVVPEVHIAERRIVVVPPAEDGEEEAGSVQTDH